jgi:hypothetical protein
MSNARELAQIPSTPSGRRNLIINGAMTVWQRGTSDDTASNNDFACDRWQIGFTGLEGNVDWDRSTDTPDDFSYSLKVSMDASETSLDAADRIHIQQKFEGQDVQHLRYGSSGAKTCTVSFWVKSSVAATYTLDIFQNEDVTSRVIGRSYTINAADTWEHKTITFVGDTAQAIENDNSEGLRLGWWLDAGSNFTSGTFSEDWQDYDITERIHSTTGWLESTSPEFYITGVQLEVGTVATEFEHRSYGEELALCQRYCIVYGGDSIYDRIGTGHSVTANLWSAFIILPVEMRTGATESTSADSDFALYHSSTVTALTSLSLNYTTRKTVTLDGSVAGGLTAGRSVQLLTNATTNARLTLDAEL